MRFKKLLRQSPPMIIFMLLFAGANATGLYLLSKRDQNIIKIAFMNGSVEILTLDLNDIRVLKNNRKLLKKWVEKAADRYLEKVEHLNRYPDRNVVAAGVLRYKTPYLP